eukprot:g4935.t1
MQSGSADTELTEALRKAKLNRDKRTKELENLKKLNGIVSGPAAASVSSYSSYSSYSSDSGDSNTGVPPPSAPPPTFQIAGSSSSSSSSSSYSSDYSYSDESNPPAAPTVPPPTNVFYSSSSSSSYSGYSDPRQPAQPTPPPSVNVDDVTQKPKQIDLTAASICIQRNVRGHISRRKTHKKRVRHDAAVRIQSVVRGRHDRLHAAHVRALKKNDESYEMYLMQEALITSNDFEYMSNEAKRLEQKVHLLRRKLKKHKNPKLESKLKETEKEWEAMKLRASKAKKAEEREEKHTDAKEAKQDHVDSNVNLAAHKILMEDLIMREEQTRAFDAEKERLKKRNLARKKKKMGSRKRRDDPAGWHSKIDPETKRKYYINDETKETTWIKPEPIPGGAKYKSEKKKNEWNGWRKYKDPKTGLTYWNNKELGKTSWENPKLLAADGKISEAERKKRRKWRRVLLLKVRLKKEEEINADKLKDGTIDGWKIYVSKENGKPYWYNVETKESQWHDPHHISGNVTSWRQFFDKDTGKSYYHNHETGETTWTRPKELELGK